MPELGREALEAILATAARAPSAHNTQPWIVRVDGGRVIVRTDAARWLRHGDPTRRDLRLSLGAFIEALRIAFAASGVRAEPADVPEGAGTALALQAAASVTDADLMAVSLLRQRQTSRLRYVPRSPEPAVLEALTHAARDAGLDLHLVARGTAERRDLDGWFYAATREGWLDVRAVAELRAWVRIDPEGARRPEDGLSTHCLGLSPSETAAMAALVRPPLWRTAHAIFLAPLLAASLARAETRAFEEAPLAGVLVATSGEAGACGAALLHFWLAATRLGVALAPASALLDRRGWELGRHLGVAPARLVAAFRLGRSAPPPRSQRRPVGRFASFAGNGTAVA